MPASLNGPLQESQLLLGHTHSSLKATKPSRETLKCDTQKLVLAPTAATG